MAKVRDHPMLQVEVKVDYGAYQDRGLTAPRKRRLKGVTIMALADTWVQMMVIGPQHLEELGITMEECHRAAMVINVANNVPNKMMGIVLLEISARDSKGRRFYSWQQAYILQGADQVFLNHEALEDLGCLGQRLPTVGE